MEKVPADVFYQAFLSTLSLRRATLWDLTGGLSYDNFYPRSPCGERPTNHDQATKPYQISIHALLAESDQKLAEAIKPS